MSQRGAEEIDDAFVPRRVEPEAAVELDGDEILYVANPSRLFTLNPTARVVWHSLDGQISVAALADELAEEFGIAGEAMRRDVLALVQELGRSGLLLDVSADAASIERDALTPSASEGDGDGTRPA